MILIEKYLQAEVKRYRRAYNIMTVFFAIMTILFVLSIINMSTIAKKVDLAFEGSNITVNTTIDYTQLTAKEKVVAEKMIADMKPMYLAKQYSITFTKDILHYSNNKSYRRLLGLNKVGHTGYELYIQFTGNLRKDKTTLCHEAMHSSFSRSDGIDHDIIYDIAPTMICYKSRVLR